MPPAMTEQTRQAAGLSGETKFGVTADMVRASFFNDANTHGGKVPVQSNADGTLDEEGWLWKEVLGQDTPPMSKKLACRLDERIKGHKNSLFLVVAPSGAGKSFAAWQLGTIRHVDLLDANRNDKHSLFSLWRRTVTANKLPDDLVLKHGETAATVGQPKLNSRKAVYHAWILLCSLTAMRAQCSGPSDWLFLQRHRPRRVINGYATALAVAEDHRLHYDALAKLVTRDNTRGPQTVLVVDEASHALPHTRDPTFAPLGDTTPRSSPPPSPRNAPQKAAAHVSCSGAGRDAGAGSHAVAGRKTETDGSTTVDDGRASHSGLLGCLLQAAMAMGRCMIAMGTSFSFAAATHVAQSGSDHPLWARNTHNTLGSYMKVDAFPKLSAEECAEYIQFYADRLGVELDPDVLSDVCQQLQGVCQCLALLHWPMSHRSLGALLQGALPSCTTLSCVSSGSLAPTSSTFGVTARFPTLLLNHCPTVGRSSYCSAGCVPTTPPWWVRWMPTRHTFFTLCYACWPRTMCSAGPASLFPCPLPWPRTTRSTSLMLDSHTWMETPRAKGNTPSGSLLLWSCALTCPARSEPRLDLLTLGSRSCRYACKVPAPR